MDDRTYKGVGMKYNQAIRTAIRHGKEGSGGLVDSMTNQVRLKEGNRAAAEFRKEVVAKSRRNG